MTIKNFLYKMHIYKTKVNFYDCDPAGILFFGNIYHYCHSAYENLISSFNLKEDYFINEDYLVPIIKSEASYHKSFKYNEVIIIEVKVTQLKSSSFELEYFCKNEKGEKCVIVKTVHVFMDKKSWKKMEIPSGVKEGFNLHIL